MVDKKEIIGYIKTKFALYKGGGAYDCVAV